jgi:hypothetical protein
VIGTGTTSLHTSFYSKRPVIATISRDPHHHDVALFTAMEMLGFVFGAGLGGMLSMIDGTIMGVRVTPFTAPAIFSALAAVCLLTVSGFLRPLRPTPCDLQRPTPRPP